MINDKLQERYNVLIGRTRVDVIGRFSNMTTDELRSYCERFNSYFSGSGNHCKKCVESGDFISCFIQKAVGQSHQGFINFHHLSAADGLELKMYFKAPGENELGQNAKEANPDVPSKTSPPIVTTVHYHRP